jgi:hypothetical protein
VLYHRVRARLAPIAELRVTASRAVLVHEHPLVVPDPRCSPPPEHSVLRELAKVGHLSPKEAAERMGLGLRNVQRALRQLAEDGMCRPERVGRHLEYYLEDTTFAEPTRSEVGPPRE